MWEWLCSKTVMHLGAQTVDGNEEERKDEPVRWPDNANKCRRGNTAAESIPLNGFTIQIRWQSHDSSMAADCMWSARWRDRCTDCVGARGCGCLTFALMGISVGCCGCTCTLTRVTRRYRLKQGRRRLMMPGETPGHVTRSATSDVLKRRLRLAAVRGLSLAQTLAQSSQADSNRSKLTSASLLLFDPQHHVKQGARVQDTASPGKVQR